MAEITEELKDKVSSNGSGDGGGRSKLASPGVIVPAVATVATAAAAGLAAKKGPDLMKKLKGEVGNEGEELGRKGVQGVKEGLSQAGPVGKVASKLMGGGGGGGGQKGGKTRRLPIQRWTDVAVPVNKAYEAWIQWEEWPKFMHRVLEANPDEGEDGQIQVREKIWFWTREWTGEITDQRKNDRIAWKTVSGMQHSGVVSFHKIDANLTRVMVDMDFVPTGVFEKMASGMRFVKRAVQADLARFKAYVEFNDAKDLEYKSSPAEMEQNQDGEGDDEDGESQEAENRNESGEDNDDDRDRESDREERAKRREERQKAASAS